MKVRINFRLTRDEAGYPPADWESLWAESVGEQVYCIDNVPFYIRGISAGDHVRARKEGVEYIFDGVVSASLNSTLRAFVNQKEDVPRVIDALVKLGADCEISNIPRLVSIHIPSSISLIPIVKSLQRMEMDGLLEYEEAAVRHD
jgi:hypothetical protein